MVNPMGEPDREGILKEVAFLSQKGLCYLVAKVSHRLNVDLFSNILNALCSFNLFCSWPTLIQR